MRFTFPFGVVSIGVMQARLGCRRDEWFVWRLPDGKASEVKDAHRHMVALFERIKAAEASLGTMPHNAASGMQARSRELPALVDSCEHYATTDPSIPRTAGTGAAAERVPL